MTLENEKKHLVKGFNDFLSMKTMRRTRLTRNKPDIDELWKHTKEYFFMPWILNHSELFERSDRSIVRILKCPGCTFISSDQFAASLMSTHLDIHRQELYFEKWYSNEVWDRRIEEAVKHIGQYSRPWSEPDIYESFKNIDFGDSQ